MSKTKEATKELQNAKYSFDSSRNAWFCGKKPIEEEEVLIHLIRYAKSQNIEWAGEWAKSELETAKMTPELTTARFVKAHMVRNRNRRIAGKYLFLRWAKEVGIEIVGKLDDFMRKNSLIVNRFYNEIAAGYECCRKQARAAGRVMRSVFIGWDLRDEDTEEIEAEARRPHQKIKPDINISQRPNREGLRQYLEFMNKLFNSDP